MKNERLDLSSVDWISLLKRLGVEHKLIANPKKRGPCPLEQTGNTRFRFDNKGGRGTWVCNCGAGDGVQFVALFLGKTYGEAIGIIREMIGVNPKWKMQPQVMQSPSDVKDERQIAKARKNLRKTWAEGRPLMQTPAWVYLQSRVPGLKLEWLSGNFRFHSRLFHHDDENGQQSSRPGLLSRVVNPCSGRAVTIHRTYLTPSGEKASVSPSQIKKVMATVVDKMSGEAIRVNTATGSTVVVAEGVENALAWVAATGNRYPVYAALNCFNMGQFLWPECTKTLVIAADNDAPNPRSGLRPGQHYAAILKDRAMAAKIDVAVIIPPDVGVDFDDMWCDGRFDIFEIPLKEIALP